MNAFFRNQKPVTRRVVAAVALLAVGMSGAFAQNVDVPLRAQGSTIEAPGDMLAGPQGQPCPHPITMTYTAQAPMTPTPTLTDFPAVWLNTSNPNYTVANSVFNHAAIDKKFGHTFNFKPPAGMCCSMKDGKLTVTYKALQPGRSNSSSDAGNDGGGPFRNGMPLNNMQAGGYNHIWPNAPVAAGAMVTHSYVIPASWIASGRVSFGAQDDTAVVKATLTISGCCLTPTQPEK